MFPIAHAYLMEQLFAEPTPQHYLGCIWPDMLYDGPLTHRQTHRGCLPLLAFARAEAPEIIPFVRAALTHGAEPHGFDWFSDESYDAGAAKGYAFERGRPFVDDVVAATGVDAELGLWKTHNFVEMSFEIALGAQYPHLGRAVAAACADSVLVRQVTSPLARHFGVDGATLAWDIHHFPEAMALETPDSMDLARAYAVQLEIKHQVKQPDIPAMAAIIDRIWTALAPDRATFLAHCIREVKAVLRL